MENLLIITMASDIAIAESTAAELDSYKVYVFDPTLVDVIRDSSLRNVELLSWDACPPFPGMVQRANADAATLERALDAALRPLLQDQSMEGWQHLNLYYFFIGYHWYSGLWNDMREKLSAGRPYVFLNDNPANFYWPSFMPALLLLQLLRTWAVPFSASRYGVRPDESDVIMDLDTNTATERYDVLTHLPTCFYDAAYVNAEVLATGKRSINIEPKYWRVPLTPTTSVTLARLAHLPGRLAPATLAALDTLDTAMQVQLDTLLAPYIATPDYRARQASQLSMLYRCQIANLHLLEKYFSGAAPAKLLLSDHDAGFHGPLMAFAERHAIPVLMVPHSKTSIDVDFGYDNVTMLTHPMQGLPHLFNGRRRRLLHFTLNYEETFSSRSAVPAPLRRIGLLLNGLSLNGVQCTDLPTYLDGIRAISDWCRRRRIELTIRCRPGQSLSALLQQSIDIDAQAIDAVLRSSLAAFSADIDLCLMYDAPTNADITFLQSGVAVLNPVPAPLSAGESSTANQDVVPRAGVADTLALLDGFVNDVTSLAEFRNAQFGRYVSLFGSARALRRFL